MAIITSRANPEIKKTKKLHQKKYRTDSYLIEGWHLFEEAIQAKALIRNVFVTPEHVERVPDGYPICLVAPEVLKDLADSPSPQGIVAEVFISEQDLPETFSGKWLVLEDVQDPGNVGTLIRTADAAGFDGVLISEKTADIYNLKTLRSMQGSHFHLPIYRAKMATILEQLQRVAIPVLATTLSEKSVDYRTLPKQVDFALVMGNEGQGISQQVVDVAHQLVHIPMPGQAESLNVAVAGGIVMFSLL